MHSRFTNLSKSLFAGIVFFSIIRFHLPSLLPDVVSHWWFDLVLCMIIPIWLLFVREDIIGSLKDVYILAILLLPILLISVVLSAYPLYAVINFFKIFLYIMLVILLMSLLKRSNINIGFFIKVIDVSFLLILVVAFIQLFDLPIIGDFIKQLYGEKRLRSIWTGNPRIYSTFRNANFFGVYLSFMLTIWVNFYLYYGKQNRWLFIRLLPLLILIVASGSRTGFLASIVILILSFATHQFTFKKIIKYSVSIIILTLTSVIIADVLADIYDLTRAFGRFQNLVNIVTSENLYADATLGERIDLQLRALDFIADRPWFGYGYLPNDISPHNAFLTLILCFGFIGLFAIMVTGLLLSFRVFRYQYTSIDAKYFKKIYLIFTSGLFIAMLAGDFIFTSQVMFLWTLITALALSGPLESGYKKLVRKDQILTEVEIKTNKKSPVIN